MNGNSKAAFAFTLIILLSLSLTFANQDSNKKENPRSLPSLDFAWKWKGDAEDLAVDNNIIFALGKKSVTAIDVQSGKELWKAELTSETNTIPTGLQPLNFSLAAGLNNTIFIIDKKTGQILTKTEFDKDVRQIFGQPFMVWLQQKVPGEGGIDELVKLDEKTAKIISRKALPQITDIMIHQGIIIVVCGDYSENPSIAFGLREVDLSEVWNIQIPQFAGTTVIDDKVFINTYPDRSTLKDECDYADDIFAPLDPETGQLGEPLPQREPSDLSSSDDDWIFQIVQSNEETSRYRRNKPETGLPIWNLDLPCELESDLIQGKDLFIHCSSGSGRGYFMHIDWETGDIKAKAYGLRNIKSLFRAGENLAAFSWDGEIAVFSPLKFGPPENTIHSVESEVHRILHSEELTAKECWWENLDDAYKDLMDLGEDALPHITNEIDNLSPSATSVAARVLGENGYKDAASRLGGKLPNVHRCSDAGWAMHNPPIAILQALAKIGSKSEFESIIQVIWNDQQEGQVRLEALATLATLADSESKHLLDEAISSVLPKPFKWYVPPNPGKYEARLGTPISRKELMQSYENNNYEEALWLHASASSVRIKQNDKELIIFPYSNYGGPGDLWLIERSSKGELSPAQFLGISVHDDSLVEKENKFQASINDKNLIIKFENKSFQVDLNSLDKDQDGDGLSDIFERRLRTNPQQKDTDKDGIIDSEDLSPDKSGHASSEQERITEAIFNQYFGFKSSNSSGAELSVIINDVALDWKGLKGPCITLTKEEDEQFLKEAGYDGIPHISIAPNAQHDIGEAENYDLADNERVYSLTIYRGGLDAVGYDIIVRQLDDDWYIKRIIFRWIS